MNIEESNLDIIKREDRELYNLIISQPYGKSKKIIDGVFKDIEIDIYNDFDEVYDYDKLRAFIKEGLIKGKDSEWVVIENNNIVEVGIADTAAIQARYPNLIRSKKENLYKVLRSFKKSRDNKFQNIIYKSSLDKSAIQTFETTALIKQGIRLKKESKRFRKIFDSLEQEQIEKINSVLDTTIVGLVPMIVSAALYRKFLGNLKLSLWHIVDEKDSGKTTLMEIIESIIDIYQEDKLSNIFGDKAKVDAGSLNAAWILHQDETTIMFNDFKLLTNSTLKLNLAYAKKQVIVEAPLVIMTSHDDAQDVYSEQFQARVLKIYPRGGSILNKIEDLNESSERVEAVTYFYVRRAIEEALDKARHQPDLLAEEVKEFVEHHRVEKHNPLDIVRSALFNLIQSLHSDITGKLDKSFLKYGFEIGKKRVPGGSKAILFVTGMMKMKKDFFGNLIQDKTIYYEINKSMYEDFGFEFVKTLSFENSEGLPSRRQDAWVIDITEFITNFEGVDDIEVEVDKIDGRVEEDYLKEIEDKLQIQRPIKPPPPDFTN